jgi:hypothetical protein
VAIDLHYLLTFHGNDGKLEPQRLLGSAVRALHEQPVLSRQKIRSVINAAINADPQHYLATSDLDKDLELVKFTPLPLTLEELSKLWSVFFQTPYTLSIAYQGTVVLIESDSTPRTALPVRERNVYVITFRQPVIERVTSTTGPNDPIVSTSTLRITGARLRSDTTQIRIDTIELTLPADQVSDTQLDIPLPAGLSAGVHGVQIIQPMRMGTPPVAHGGVESNVAPFVLHPMIAPPAITNVTPTRDHDTPVVVDGVTLLSATITVTFTPNVGKTQRVKLLLYQFNAPEGRPPRTYSFNAPLDNGIPMGNQTDTASITFAVQRVFPGQYLVRVQVDGAESALAQDAQGRYNAPQVTI